jgi:hypothetical protein
MALGALTGAYLLGFMRPVFGHNILALFVLSGVLRLAVTMVMFPKLKEVRGTMRSALEQPVMVTIPDAAIVHRQPLLYRPKEWMNLGRRPLALETVPIEAESLDTNRGLFYRPREWENFGKPMASEEVSAHADPATTNRGLFYRPREWADFGKQSPAEVQPAPSQTGTEAVAANWGLFYRPGEWERFGRPIKHEPKVSQAHIEGENSTVRMGLLHRAHGLVKSNQPAAASRVDSTRKLQTAAVLA